MRRFLFIIFALLAIVNISWTKHVHRHDAEKVARNFISGHASFQQESAVLFYHQEMAFPDNPESQDKFVYYYVFQTTPSGFVIVAGDDRVYPILGYSLEGYFDLNNVPINARKWFDMYKKEIGYIAENDIQATDLIQNSWKKWRNENVDRTSVVLAVDPLVKTKWNQSPYYNALCPGGSYTGCTATATAQVMKYWNHPEKGYGFHSYNHETYGTLSANFGNTTYQWNLMPDVVNSTNNAVATLMYHVGISMNMNYSPQGSNAHVLSYNGSIPQSAEESLKKYFGYKPTLKGIEKKNYTDAHWISLIKTELDKSRPIIYAGWSQTGGHAFVCDGYDNNQFFHFNWGWGGAYDGFFILTTLNPGSGSGYTNYQQMITGIEPIATNQTYVLKLSEKVKVTPSPMTFGRDFTVKTNILNSGGGTFNGDFCAAVFDDDWNFIDYVEILTNRTLTGNSSFSSSLVFQNSGLLSMLPGEYYIGIYYKPAGANEWQRVADNGANVNFVSHRVYFAADIELYTDLMVTPGTNNLVEGKNAKVVVNVVNDGFSTFKGWYSADLYDLNGDWVANFGTLYESHGLSPGNYYLPPYLVFETNNLEAPPGTYFLAIQYKPLNKDWSLAGSSYHANPIYVIVKGQEIIPDPYEPNNTPQTAYNLPVTFSNQTAKVTTEHSNCHVVNDFDYYKIDLPAGYRYQITARLHDSYSSENGNEYTMDAMFSTSTNGSNWSEMYDDVMYQSINLVGAQSFYVQVVPFFEGEKGTYLLDIDIIRFPIVSTDDKLLLFKVNTYPNPVDDILNVKILPNHWAMNLSLYNLAGELIQIEKFQNEDEIWQIPVHHLKEGNYLLTLTDGSQIISKKIVVCH